MFPQYYIDSDMFACSNIKPHNIVLIATKGKELNIDIPEDINFCEGVDPSLTSNTMSCNETIKPAKDITSHVVTRSVESRKRHLLNGSSHNYQNTR